MKNYRNPFLAALAVNLLLAGAFTFFWWYDPGILLRARLAVEAHPGAGKDLPSATIPAAPAAELASPAGGSTSTPDNPHAPLAPLQISPQRLQRIGVKTGAVQYKNVHDTISTAGNVDVDERLESSVQLRFDGWIDKVFVNSTYQFVRKGQPLFTIYSPDLVATEREYVLARQNERLLAASTVPGVAAGGALLLASSAERLKQWGIPEDEIVHLQKTGQVGQELTIDSPVSGYVTERNALPHMYAKPETRLYTVTGLSTVWVYADIFQNEIGQLHVGNPATVTVDSYPGRSFRGRVDFIWPQVDPATRTVKVRLVFANPGVKLMPGMFVNVSFNIPLGRHVAIPASGVFQTGTQNIVFIDHGGGYLEPRNIELGPQAGDQFIVLKGLKAGERIVTSANFLIDSESQLQAAIGSFAPPPPGAGAAAAMNTSGAQATIEFTTSPSPPHKGNNTFRVKLTGSDNKPVEGAQVTVTLFMPAMPAMGMSAMRTVVTLSDKGGGMYEGTGNLGTGGTWQVSITAQKGGQTIAAKQLTVTAEGGM